MPIFVKAAVSLLVSILRDLLMGPFLEWFLFWALEQAAKSSRTKIDDELLAKIKEFRNKAKDQKDAAEESE